MKKNYFEVNLCNDELKEFRVICNYTPLLGIREKVTGRVISVKCPHETCITNYGLTCEKECKFVSEEAETPRICTADTIQHALLGIPGCADVMQNIQKFDMRIYIHVYYLTSEDIKFPTEEEVPDVKETHEVWILSEPQKIIRQDYEITDFKTRYHKDLNGIKHQILVGCKIKRVSNIDNISYFIDNIIPNLPKQKAEKFYELLKKFSYRTFMNSMDDEFMDKIQEIRKSPD